MLLHKYWYAIISTSRGSLNKKYLGVVIINWLKVKSSTFFSYLKFLSPELEEFHLILPLAWYHAQQTNSLTGGSSSKRTDSGVALTHEKQRPAVLHNDKRQIQSNYNLIHNIALCPLTPPDSIVAKLSYCMNESLWKKKNMLAISSQTPSINPYLPYLNNN